MLISQENNYITLLNSIGIPGVRDGIKTFLNQELFSLARLNKVQLLYAQSTATVADDLITKHNQTIQTIVEVADILNINKINYAVFKTIKPFMSTPSDIDILLPDAELQQAKILLSNQGYHNVTKDRFCVTMQKKTNVDLYLHPSVANIPYLNREILMRYKRVTDLQGSGVSVLSDEAEFIAVSSHSFYKEQMVTLNDFITLAILAENSDLKKIPEIVEELIVHDAVLMVLAVCKSIIGDYPLPLKLLRLIEKMDPPLIHVAKMPFKFPLGTICKIMLKKIRTDRQTKKHFPRAILADLSKRHVLDVFKHLTRETY